jgi:enoyl-CoA hydratase/carnithine racemase
MSSKTYATLNCEFDEGLAVLTLNRPQALNAFTVEMANELVEAFQRLGRDEDVAAIIVTGAGRAFCAGMDLSAPGNPFGLDEALRPTLADMTERLDDPAILHGVRDTGGRVALAIYECPKPVIAAINGPAVGVGATMTLPMDFRLAAETARIGFVFGRLGLTPEACSSWFLPRLVGLQQALEWIYSADIVDANEALKAGLVRSVHPADDLLTAAKSLARRLTLGRSPVATALARQMMLRNPNLESPLEAHQIESLAMSYSSIGDGREGVAAFREKRTPRFDGRVGEMPPFYPWW